MAKKKVISYYVPKDHEREGNRWCKNNGYEVWVEETAHKANLYKIFVQKGDKKAEMNKIYKEEDVWQAYYALSFKIMNDKLNKTNKSTENGKEARNTEDTKKPEADRWQEKQQTLAI
jgi:hypothetical protein